jgi:hypothetical protein
MQISEKLQRSSFQRLDKRSEKKRGTVHGTSKLFEIEKGETGGEQSEENAHHFL